MRYVVSVLVLFFGLTVHSSAQSTSDGSIYSRFGIGELRTFSSSQLQGMGGGGYGFSSFGAMNLSNPATWGMQVLTRVSAGMIFENVRATDNSNQTSKLSSGAFNALQISFPLEANKLGLGLAFVPYSRVSFRVDVDGSVLPDPVSQDTTGFRINFKGNGGLQQFMGGLGWRISDRVSFGASANFIFGVLEDSRRTTFPGSNFRAAVLTTSTRLFGLTGTFGGIVHFPGLLREDDMFSVGGSLTLPTALNGTRVLTLGERDNVDSLRTKTSGNVHLPLGAGLGISYQVAARWSLIADGRYEPWTNFRSDFSFPGFDATTGGSMRDRIRASAGFEFLPAGRDLLASYFKRIAYRLGIFYDRSYIDPVPNTSIRTIGATGGISLPTYNPGTRIDINVSIGTRGTTNNGLVRDTFIRIGANINFGERWFLKRKLG